MRSSNSTKTSEEEKKTSQLQLQASPGKELVFEILKPADGDMMVLLIHSMQSHKVSTGPLHVTDLGGGDGQMLEYLLKLGNQLVVNINEPDQPLREMYLRKAQAKAVANQLTLGFISDKKMEDIAKIPDTANVLVVSHSLYYNTNKWYKPNCELNNHLFTKFLSWVKEEGTICVILQSTASTNRQGAHNQPLASLHQLEDVIYPLIERTRDNNYATAEMLEEALQDYSEKLTQQTNRRIKFKSSEHIICSIDLGEVTFATNPQNNNKYDQQDIRTRQLFKFYTRDKYDELSPEKQASLLDFIKKFCKTVDGKYVVTHVNKAIAFQEIAATSQTHNNRSNKL